MAAARPKLQPDIKPMSDANQSLSPAAAEIACYLAAAAMTGVATIVAVAVDRTVTIPNLSLVFVVPVIVAGLWLGLGPALASAVLGALAFNFFLTEPRYTLVVDDPANVWAIGLLFVVGLIVSGVAFTSRQRATEAATVARQVAVLQRYSHAIGAAGDPKSIIATTAQTLASLFQVPSAVILFRGGEVVSVERAGGGAEPAEADLEAARLSLTTKTATRGGVYPNLAARFDFWPVEMAGGESAVVGLAFDPDERPSTPETLIDIVRRLFGLALTRQNKTPP